MASLAVDLALSVLLLWWAWRFFLPLEEVVNIELFDETGDLWRALREPILAWPAEYGPLYPLWYRFLALFDPEPLRLYYHSYRWVGILAAVLFYLALRRMRVARPPAFWAAMVLLMSQGQARVWPRISVFWAVVLGLGWVVVGHDEDTPSWMRWMNAAWVLGWSAFVRPGLTMPALVLFLVALTLGLRRRFEGISWRRGALWATLLIPLMLWGSPYRSDRLLLAFSQHFVVRRADMGDPIPDPWVNTRYIERYFSRTDSLWAMFRERPDLFRDHVLFNFRSLFDLPPLKRPYAPKRFYSKKHLVLYFLLAAWPGLFVAWRRWPEYAAEITAAGLVLGQSMVNVLLISPHIHYLYLGWVASLMGYGLVLGVGWQDWARRRDLRGLAYWGTLLAVLALSWRLFGGRTVTYWIQSLKDPSRRVPSVARFIRRLPLPKDRTLYTLGTDGEWVVYFGPQFVSLDDAFRASGKPLAVFLREQRVDLIVMGDPRLCTRDPETCQDLKARPEQWGYVLRYAPLEGGGRYPILIRADLLPPGSEDEGGELPAQRP